MTIDPTQQVDDYNRTNNSLTATCAVDDARFSGPGDVARASLH